MTDTYWKATRCDGFDFHTGTIDYASALVSGKTLVPILPAADGFPGPGWLHLATTPTECAGMSWPCRLFEVEPVGRVRRDVDHPHKIGCRGVRVVREVDAHLALGPQGHQIAALIDRARALTGDEAARLAAAAGDAAWDAAGDAAGDAAWDAAWAAAGDAARDAAWDAAWDAARDAAWDAGDAAWDAAWAAAGDAARDAAGALVVADLVGQHGLTAAHLDTLLAPWLAVIGDPLAVEVVS